MAPTRGERRNEERKHAGVQLPINQGATGLSASRRFRAQDEFDTTRVRPIQLPPCPPQRPRFLWVLTSASLGYSSALLDCPRRVDIVWPDYYQLGHVHVPQRL